MNLHKIIGIINPSRSYKTIVFFKFFTEKSISKEKPTKCDVSSLTSPGQCWIIGLLICMVWVRDGIGSAVIVRENHTVQYCRAS